MSFWTEASMEPKRNFRFKISSGGWFAEQSTWWWAKSVDKPSFDVSSSEYQLINHKFKYPGILTWKNISITVVDFANGGPSATQALEEELIKIGYSRPTANKPMAGIAKTNESTVDGLLVQQLDSNGTKSIDEFKLVGAFIVSTSHSKLDYSDDSITETTIEIAYDYADYSGATSSGTPGNPNFYKNWNPPDKMATEFIDADKEGRTVAGQAVSTGTTKTFE